MSKIIEIELNESYNIDCIEGIYLLDNESIDLVVTSPPYETLRKNDDYELVTLDDIEEIAALLKDKMKIGGVIVWVVSDKTVNGCESLISFEHAKIFKNAGFSVETMIYEKSNFANPTKNFYHNIFEYMFLFVNGSKPRVFNPIKDKLNAYGDCTVWGKNTHRQVNGSLEERDVRFYKKYGKRTNIWRYKTGYTHSAKDKIAYKHPAIFPEQLVHDHIISWTNEDDTVLDIFAGSGTTGIVAANLNRNYILFEKSEYYFNEVLIPRLNERGII